MSNSFDNFTHRMAQAQDEQIAALDLEARVRDRVLSGAKPRANRSSRGWVAGGTVVTLVAAAAAAVVFVDFGPDRITAIHDGTQLEVGAWIDAKTAPEQLDFSDGTVITLDQGSAVRVAAMTERGAHLMLERGTADLEVVHTGEADWTVQAGPYTIEVTGTAFQTSWDPDQQRIAVQMRDGSIVVTGPGLDPGGQDVSGVGSLTWPPDEEVTLNTVDGEADEVVEEPAPVEQAAPAGTAEPVADWFDEYKARDYAAAMELARSSGIDALVASETANRLLGLADLAKQTGDTKAQVQVLEGLRSRYAGTNDAARAALELGRIHDKQGDHGAAAGWYRKAHDESLEARNGEIALGLHMTALANAADGKAAKQAAIEYLEKYPAGSYVAKAKELAKRKR